MASLRCVKLNFACKSCRRRGVSREWHTRSLAIGRRGVIIMWGVTAGKASHYANARGVTVGRWDATLVHIINLNFVYLAHHKASHSFEVKQTHCQETEGRHLPTYPEIR